MEYLKFFEFEREPFRNDSEPDFYFESGLHRRVALHLQRVVCQRKGLAVVTGGPGCGKTTVARYAARSLDASAYAVVHLTIPHESCAEGWLLPATARGFGTADPAGEPAGLIMQVRDALLEQRKRGRHPVLIVDEAQHLATRQVMQELRALLNLHDAEQKLISILLFGLPELLDTLALDAALAQRTEARLELTGLPEAWVSAYVEHRLSCAGGPSDVFEPQALSALACFSQGIPRLINTLADNALFEACLSRTVRVDASIVSAAARELGLAATGSEPDVQTPAALGLGSDVRPLDAGEARWPAPADPGSASSSADGYEAEIEIDLDGTSAVPAASPLDPAAAPLRDETPIYARPVLRSEPPDPAPQATPAESPGPAEPRDVPLGGRLAPPGADAHPAAAASSHDILDDEFVDFPTDAGIGVDIASLGSDLDLSTDTPAPAPPEGTTSSEAPEPAGIQSWLVHEPSRHGSDVEVAEPLAPDAQGGIEDDVFGAPDAPVLYELAEDAAGGEVPRPADELVPRPSAGEPSHGYEPEAEREAGRLDAAPGETPEDAGGFDLQDLMRLVDETDREGTSPRPVEHAAAQSATARSDDAEVASPGGDPLGPAGPDRDEALLAPPAPDPAAFAPAETGTAPPGLELEGAPGQPAPADAGSASPGTTGGHARAFATADEDADEDGHWADDPQGGGSDDDAEVDLARLIEEGSGEAEAAPDGDAAEAPRREDSPAQPGSVTGDLEQIFAQIQTD